MTRLLSLSEPRVLRVRFDRPVRTKPNRVAALIGCTCWVRIRKTGKPCGGRATHTVEGSGGIAVCGRHATCAERWGELPVIVDGPMWRKP